MGSARCVILAFTLTIVINVFLSYLLLRVVTWIIEVVRMVGPWCVVHHCSSLVLLKVPACLRTCWCTRALLGGGGC